jgi:hypothetical protein
MSDKPKDEPLVDLDEIVGEPPAGDAFPDDFLSNDQSAVGKADGPDKTDGSDDQKKDES